LAFLLALLSIFFGCAEAEPDASDSLTLFCGSASKPAMELITARFQRETGVEVNTIFGGSGTLLSQIELSGQGEIYLPGSPDYILIAEKKGLLVEGSERIVAYLVPAIVTPAGNPAGIHALPDLARPGARAGMGNPESVCLGLYSVEILEANGLLEEVMENVVTFGGSCSKTANLAAMSKLDAILGWRVFHYWNPDRMELVHIDPEKIPRISYIPISIPIHTRDLELSRSFIDFVLSPKGLSVYRDLGYLTDLEAARALAPRATVGGEYELPEEYFASLDQLSRRR